MSTIRLGSRTTAEQALRGASLSGKRAIVTGASSGLGVETTRVLALAGADVTLAVRSVPAGEAVAADLRAALPLTAGKLDVRPLDLADLASVRAFTDAIAAEGRPLDLLINNAGVMAPPLGKTAQGFELQLGTNHLGHFLLTERLRPRMTAGRIVNVSSGLHTRGSGARLLETLDGDRAYERRKYVPFDAYGDSKLANILFTRALAKRLPPSVLAFSLHPGVIPTNLSRSMGALGTVFRTVGRLFMKTVAQGAATSVFAATAPELEGASGAYLSDCAIATPKAEALDDALADKVWALSERCVAAS
jgi:NAD(P)-dependent dehydrogenase (short-subunit alcohol dehydrogenase family)